MLSPQITKSVRWIARLSSLVSIGLLLAFLFGEDGLNLQLSATEWLGLLFFPGGVIIGMVLGWWREGWGGLIAIASLAAFYLEQYFISGRLPGGPWFILFSLPGFLFVLSWWLTHRTDGGVHPPTHYSPA